MLKRLILLSQVIACLCWTTLDESLAATPATPPEARTRVVFSHLLPRLGHWLRSKGRGAYAGKRRCGIHLPGRRQFLRRTEWRTSGLSERERDRTRRFSGVLYLRSFR